MALELNEDASADPGNANFLALACDLAYLPEAEAKPGYQTELGLDARLLSVGNTQAYLATNGNHIVVAFRGTESPTTIDGLKDCLLTDAANLLIVPEGRLGTDLAAAGVGAKFHMGFVKAIGDIWDPLYEAVEAEMKQKKRPLWLTGHSLGGALALLAAWLFKRKFVRVHQVYTFGGPMIGNKLAVEAIDREFPNKIVRCVNGPDPVPLLPTMSFIANEYAHCQVENLLGPAAQTANFLKELAAGAVDGILKGAIVDEIWKAVSERAEAHSIANYRKLIGR
jgi:hypothetical protein